MDYGRNIDAINAFIKVIVEFIRVHKRDILKRREIGGELSAALPYPIGNVGTIVNFEISTTNRRKALGYYAWIERDDSRRIKMIISYDAIFNDTHAKHSFDFSGPNYYFMTEKRLDVPGGKTSFYAILAHEVQHVIDFLKNRSYDRIFSGVDENKLDNAYTANKMEINARVSQIYAEMLVEVNSYFDELLSTRYCGENVAMYIAKKLQKDIPEIIDGFKSQMFSILANGTELNALPEKFQNYLKRKFGDIVKSIKNRIDDRIRNASIDDSSWPKNINSMADILACDTSCIDDNSIWHCCTFNVKHNLFSN